jgi:uncharacterized protein YifN (PemK superfamily)
MIFAQIMAIKYRPAPGAILLCDFQGNIQPEINKKRPVIVLASVSPGLCIVVPLSTTEPFPLQKWHYLLSTPDPLPPPYDAQEHWVKGDMVNTISFARLSFPFRSKDSRGKRIYDYKNVSAEDMCRILSCVARAVFPPGWAIDKLA